VEAAAASGRWLRVRVLLQALWSALLAALIGLLVGGAGTGAVVPVAAAFVLVLAYWLLTDRAATSRWPGLARLPGAVAVPRLRLEEAVIERAAVVMAGASGPAGLGVGQFDADYVKVPVTNDRRAPVAAEDVQGWLAFEDASGNSLAEGVQARWAHTEQAADRGPFARLDDPALNEARIPAGSTRHLDVVACADQLGGFRMWTNQSTLMLADPHYILGNGDVVATLTVRGSNAPEVEVRLRVTRDGGGVRVAPES
jgi:hypothetical protein